MGNDSDKDFISEINRLKEKELFPDKLGNKIVKSIQELSLRKKELDAIKSGAKAVLEQKGFEKTARSIFDYCCDLIGATSGYVALLSDTGEENEVLFLEAGGLECDVNPELPMPIRGLRERAYVEKRAVFHNDFMKSEWVKYMPKGHVVLKNVLFAPMIIEDKTVGIIGMANKPSDFTENDAEMAQGFGELAAVALQNSWNLDKRIKAEEEQEKLIKDLQKALDEVKTLSGLLPICAHCKNIRDDKGYWNKIEAYIDKHSNAEFSHAICPECMEKYYS